MFVQVQAQQQRVSGPMSQSVSALQRRPHLSEDQKEVWSRGVQVVTELKTCSQCKDLGFPLSELRSPLEHFELKSEVI